MSGSNPDNRRHPESTFEAEYPYNQSTITRGGHEIHINDTPDRESLRIAHTKGSYVEIDKTGRTVVNSAGGGYYYFSKGFTTSVDGNYDVKVAGVRNMNVDGSINEVTAGNRYMNSGGDMILGVGGKFTSEIVNDKYEDVGGNSTSRVKGSLATAVEGDVGSVISGSKVENLGQDWQVNFGGNIEMLGDGGVRIVCKNFVVEAESITLKTKGGNIVIDSSALTKIVGRPVSINP